jgi:hypothetical protein
MQSASSFVDPENAENAPYPISNRRTNNRFCEEMSGW